jgi:RNA polymerase sigma-70 factor, ECF subfamily
MTTRLSAAKPEADSLPNRDGPRVVRGGEDPRPGPPGQAAGEDRTTRLYRTYGPIIYARCRQMLSSQAAAEDATQETFVRVHRHLESAPDLSEALGWIYRIATNYCLNEIRNDKHRPVVVETIPEIPDGVGEAQLADKDLARRLVMQAPHELRTVAWLVHVDGMNQDDVAQALGISRRTVVNRLNAFAERSQRFLAREQP